MTRDRAIQPSENHLFWMTKTALGVLGVAAHLSIFTLFIALTLKIVFGTVLP